jgi:hypothetical protein
MLIEDALTAARVRADPAGVAAALREAGAPVSRDSQARWFADPRHPAVRQWLAGLTDADPAVLALHAGRAAADRKRAEAARAASKAMAARAARVAQVAAAIRGNTHPDMEYFRD